MIAAVAHIMMAGIITVNSIIYPDRYTLHCEPR